ncbi:hypothetical protein RchiOBHm_Chr4g0400131 [Rosa chinensis]|uniref:Uncharacterized protein n=1 Tax=Rosa chinensis TaxID=74649 RepID=A0A2P6QSR2_ROSCH|nr:hypothetical protein RchiOBHm_Chr4g0400131 [Rosa chinensis]
MPKKIFTGKLPSWTVERWNLVRMYDSSLTSTYVHTQVCVLVFTDNQPTYR